MSLTTKGNRLKHEPSPYLLQHAENPVDWHPWGEEPLRKAQMENKPIFLSIGYSTCHWCHVMERESFINKDIAAFLNAHFISIKVDRELLPDVDHYYMMATLLCNGQGGWPMSAFLTPEGKPFFSGTYYPPSTFLQMLDNIWRLWEEREETLRQQAQAVHERIESQNDCASSSMEKTLLDASCLRNATTSLTRIHDLECGGFGASPKFPNEVNLFFLLEMALLDGNGQCLNMAEKSLQEIARGGIHDHLGGGMHRYATDRQWRIPHFEKMLYNQANLARVFLRAWQISGMTEYLRTACAILDHVLRDLRSENSGFFSALDADSEGEEGLYYTWTWQELSEILSATDFGMFQSLFGIQQHGNFEGRNIPYLSTSHESYASQRKMPLSALLKERNRICNQLLAVREQRISPVRDEKIITAWNGMMITAFCTAGRLLGRDDYLQAAKDAANFLLDKHLREDGRLWRATLHGTPTGEGLLEDYAMLAEGLLQLHDDKIQGSWLTEAQNLIQKAVDLFHDHGDGLFYMDAGTSNTPLRTKETEDGATPCGHSVMLRMLAKLAKRTGNERYADLARGMLQSMAGRLINQPLSCFYLLTGMTEFLHGEQSHLQYAAQGQARIETEALPEGKVLIHLDLPKGWHMKLEKGTADASKITLATASAAIFKIVDCTFISTLGNRPQIHLKVQKNASELDDARFPLCLKLRLQVCNETSCLPEESVRLWVWSACVDARQNQGAANQSSA
ncbi:MAG: thioredoxin domain-containing protein [Candidatus Eutrophobiaceae bacterium]